MRDIALARSPDEPQFGVALLKFVLALRKRCSFEQALASALRGMRVDREAFRRYVQARRDRFEVAAAGAPARLRAARG